MSNRWIQTYCGDKFDLERPTKQSVHQDDIIHALFQLNRFCGHTSLAYSVGQHSMLVLAIYKLLFPDGSKDMQLACLLHDAAEAYIGDITTPVRKCINSGQLQLLEDRILATIFSCYGIEHLMPLSQEVKLCDALALMLEYYEFFDANRPTEWDFSSLKGYDAEMHIVILHAKELFEESYRCTANNFDLALKDLFLEIL
jgi:5'-deoxynucleotidase YfbR-like HD superfamily hydrolase